ncbi:MAG: protein kinase [Acidobacteriota bacterium]|nr:MAG: protein kinase [Acidobacteriota bacterium]
MTPDRWAMIKSIYFDAMELNTGERDSFLDRACSGDADLRREVESLIEAGDKAGDFIMSTAMGDAARTMVSDDPQSFIGLMFGNYKFLSLLGSGGMGDVYLAYDTRLGRQVALKLLSSQPFDSPERVRRFQREARTVSALNHPNIITIYDFGRESGREYIVSEYVEGRTLREFARNRDLSLTQIVDLAIQVADALDAAHAAGIVHRDIKPENIMLRPDGYVKVLDFGLAKLTERDPDSQVTRSDLSAGTSDFETRAGVILGTVNYMSPEQARGQKLDGRSDLFSLGVILYELIAGMRPFSGETWHHTIVAITDAEPPPIEDQAPSVPNALRDIINRLLAKNREQRYQSARELMVDLERLRSALTEDIRIQRAEITPPVTETGVRLTEVASRKSESAENSAGSKMTDTLRLRVRPDSRRVMAGIAIVFLAATAIFFYFMKGKTGPALTDKDTVLLTDFANTTGDSVFDDTLKYGLLVQLEQSPYFNVLPEERARETLSLMERPRDERITREIGREICQRRGIKALITGSIARLGRNYAITLEALNSQTGEAIAHQQTEAEGKEQVLKALGRASRALREQLGESLASIHKFDAPIEQATTTSLVAFKDYTHGIELRRRGQYSQSILAFERALERDSEFALACVQLGTSYRDIRNLAVGNRYLVRAYRLRNRVSERERLQIAATYFRHITGELDKRIETSLLLTQTYPQDPYGYHLHGNSLIISGEFDLAAEAYRKALRLDPDLALSHANLALALIARNRFDEARRAIEQGMARRLDSSGFHNRLYLLAFLDRDDQAIQRQVEWYAGRQDEYQILEMQARSHAFSGRLRDASRSFEQAAALAGARGLPAEKARILASEANLYAVFGHTRTAAGMISRVLRIMDNENIAPEELQPTLIQQLDSQPPAWTLALSGETTRARSLSEDLERRFPLDTMYRSVWLPLIGATLELKGASSEGPETALQLLQPARKYDSIAFFRTLWVRGRAHLQAGNGALAAAEFQKIIDHRGWEVLSPLWPLAHLELARAENLMGDELGSRRDYQKFLNLWDTADADLPVLIEAKKEYRRLLIGQS